MIRLPNSVIDGSTTVMTVRFRDDDGNPVTPNNIYWSMYDRDGNIINSRSQEEVIPPDTDIKILLQGNDLVLDEEHRRAERFVKVWGTFDSNLGTDLPFVEEIAFVISDIHEYQ